MKIDASKTKVFSPIKWQREQKRLKSNRLAIDREALPVLNREEIVAYRMPFHEALIRKMKMKGYDHSSEYIKQLIEFQDAYRNAAGADSIIWQRPRLMYQQDVLQHLAVSLQKAEDAHFLYQTDVEIDEILKLAVCYCFGLENWWWLGHQLLYLVRTTSDEYENDRGKRKAIVKYIFGRFLFYNANEPEMALVHLKTSRRISTVMSWKVDTLLPQLNKTVFQESCEILSKIRIIQAKGVMQKEPTVGIRYAELARNRAMEGCYNDGIAEAYLAKGNCLMAMGESSEAIKCYYRGLDTVEKHVNVDLKCEILKNIALAYLKEGTFDKALKTLKELKKYSQEHIKILYITQAHKFLGEFYLKEGTARKATPYLMTAVKLFAKLGLASETARTRNLAAISVVHCQADKKTKEDGKEFECPQQVGNGNFADPATCRRFYQCVDGFPYLNRCPSGLYFDDISKFCTFKNEARCGPIAATPAPITEPPTDLAVKCNLSDCELPYCFCSKDGTAIPGNLNSDDIPQIILLTFDGAVNLNNFEHYKKVFNKKRQNPNGCDIKGTFFISHEYSNYQMIQKLASDGHEIATETISLQSGLQDKGYEEWVGEMVGMREILKHLSNISKSEVVGMRAPFLKPGRNTQYKVIEDFGFIFDSSIGVPPSDIPVWPYTLDYKIPHECKSGSCPTKSFPGVWEVPLNEHYVKDFEGGHCPYLDQCVLHNHDPEEVFEWLQEDFSRYYEQNKAPYMMPFHTNWFSIKELEQGLHKFLDWTTSLSDVYFVTVTQALTWITDPKTLQQLNNYEPWDCQKKKENTPPPPCNLANKCALNFKTPDLNFTDIRYLETCFECPNQYPWLGDSGGTGIPGKDNYVPDNV